MTDWSNLRAKKITMTEYKRTKVGSFLYSFTMSAGGFLCRHPILAQILNATWGIIGVLIGAIMMLVVIILPKKKKSGSFNGFPYVMFGDNWGGLEGVIWFFVADNMGEDWTRHTMRHETGHAFQNAIYGPFTILLIGIPSMIRYWVRVVRKSEIPYDAIWFEGSATDLGVKYDALRNKR